MRWTKQIYETNTHFSKSWEHAKSHTNQMHCITFVLYRWIAFAHLEPLVALWLQIARYDFLMSASLQAYPWWPYLPCQRVFIHKEHRFTGQLPLQNPVHFKNVMNIIVGWDEMSQKSTRAPGFNSCGHFSLGWSGLLAQLPVYQIGYHR